MTSVENIRRASPSDAPILANLMHTFYAEAGLEAAADRVSQMFAELLSDDRLGLIWLLTVDQQVVGYVALTFTFSLEYGGTTAFVEDLFVQRPYRRRGLGQLALDTVEREAAKRGVYALHLEVGPTNTGARRLYDRSGYVASNRLLLTKPIASPLHAI